jgi:hypothetical protein
LVAYLCQVSREIERQVRILVGRRGEIEHVVVGDASLINVPPFGYRLSGNAPVALLEPARASGRPRDRPPSPILTAALAPHAPSLIEFRSS